MKIVKEKKIYGFTKETADEHTGMAILENNVWLVAHENGTAIGSDGKTYARVSEEVQSTPMPKDLYIQYFCTSFEDFDTEPPETFPIPDTDLVTLGWTTEADKPVIVRRDEEKKTQIETIE
ncbi:MAG: hypothetical protein IJT66_05970 [Clostridia bacterium]|nr:hypothetical protein [Clostridia bacterium]